MRSLLPTKKPTKRTDTKAKVLPCGRVQAQSPAAPAGSSSIWDKLEKHVSSQSLNKSESRNKIVDVISSQTTHFTALELVKRVQQNHPSIGAATIYRNLPVLVEAGILRESLSDESGQAIYEVEDEGEHHDHIVCLDCNAILEFHEEKIEALQDKVLIKLGFKQARHRHVVYAHCDYARKNPKK